MLSGIAAVLKEELAPSRLKLIVCGSTVSVMESLQSERSPLYGRFTPLGVRPLSFEQARLFMRGLPALESFERHAVASGMPRYLSLLGSGALKKAIVTEILDQNAPLFNEVRAALGQELTQSGQHFSILEQLATGDKVVGEIASPLRQKPAELTPYLDILSRIGLVERRLPLGAPSSSRLGHWHLTDPFFAFWFRFVFPFQDGLESGLRPQDLFDAPAIASWWGNALDQYRRTGARSTEEIDIVGMARSRVTLLGEVEWTNRPMSAGVLDALERYKIPALRQAGFDLSQEPTLVLLSKSGYSMRLRERATRDEKLILVDVAKELTAVADEDVVAVGGLSRAPR